VAGVLTLCACRLCAVIPLPVQSIVRAYGGLRDDTSLIVVDIVPPGKTFPEAVQAAQARNKLFTASATGSSSSSSSSGTGGGGGGCGCFGGGGGSSAPQQPAPRPSAAAAASGASSLAANPTKLDVLADIDVAAVMGLMPDDTPPVPGWYDEFVGEHLFALAVSPCLRLLGPPFQPPGCAPCCPGGSPHSRCSGCRSACWRAGQLFHERRDKQLHSAVPAVSASICFSWLPSRLPLTDDMLNQPHGRLCSQP
jgi:hypothetical protein